MRQQFKTKGNISLDDSADVVVITPGSKWEIRSAGNKYVLVKDWRSLLVFDFSCNELAKFCRDVRKAYVKKYREFLSDAKKTLASGDCLVVANELPIDLAYKLDQEAYKREPELLTELLELARDEFQGENKQVELTYAALEASELNQEAWGRLTEAGLDFASINAYWDKEGAEGFAWKVQEIHRLSGGLPVAITEWGCLTCPDAQDQGGDASGVNVETIGQYRQGERVQQSGVEALLVVFRELKRKIPIRGEFLFRGMSLCQPALAWFTPVVSLAHIATATRGNRDASSIRRPVYPQGNRRFPSCPNGSAQTPLVSRCRRSACHWKIPQACGRSKESNSFGPPIGKSHVPTSTRCNRLATPSPRLHIPCWGHTCNAVVMTRGAYIG